MRENTDVTDSLRACEYKNPQILCYDQTAMLEEKWEQADVANALRYGRTPPHDSGD